MPPAKEQSMLDRSLFVAEEKQRGFPKSGNQCVEGEIQNEAWAFYQNFFSDGPYQPDAHGVLALHIPAHYVR